MKILFYGTGSIGQRHIKNIKNYFKKEDVTIFCIKSKFYDYEGDSFLKKLGVKIFYDEISAYAEEPDIVFVCNPTSFHIKTAEMALQNGCHVFIEKPISNNTNGIKEIYDLATKKNLIVFVGYNLRFHPILRKCKQFLNEDKIGKVIYSDIHFGTYLAKVHPWRDYQNTYRTKNKYGGGAALELSHEIDYLLWFFGNVKAVSGYIDSISNFDIEVDDILDMRLQFESGLNARLNVNFFSMKTRRECYIAGENGNIHFDLVNNYLELYQVKSDQPKIYKYDNWNPDEMYTEEINTFFECIENNTKPLISIINGKKVLDVIELVKLSHTEKKVVYPRG